MIQTNTIWFIILLDFLVKKEFPNYKTTCEYSLSSLIQKQLVKMRFEKMLHTYIVLRDQEPMGEVKNSKISPIRSKQRSL